MSIALSQETQKELADILKRYPCSQAALLPLLNLLQRELGYISPEAEEMAAGTLEVPLIKIREVLTFYTLLRKEPGGRYHLQVCRNLSCTLASGQVLLDYLCQKLGISPGDTTGDGRFTLTTVECLGACQLAPVMQLNSTYLGELTEAKLEAILREPERWLSG